ncbi:MAG: diguanylate cyclase [Deltaproteobacteria bacterium]|nr:diguanylate cyclase [Deltaproteobacteria bacterium]
MENQDWVREFPGAVVVCDTRGLITAMNAAAEKIFKNQGGGRLLGTNVLDCHPEPSRIKLAEMMENPRLNVYTIEKEGRHRLIYQTPWYREGTYAGLVELSLEIPMDLPHFVRE